MEKLNFTKKDCKKLIIIMLLTDGCVSTINQGKYTYVKISYWSKDEILKNIFIKLMKIAFNFDPSHIGKEEVYFKRKRESTKILSELKKISLNLDKKSNRVSLDFIELNDRNTSRFILRLAMSGEGSISLSRKKSDGGFRYNLAFACANKKLCEEWERIFNSFKINMKIRKDSSVYSGVHGLQSITEESILNFNKIGGFIDGVRIYKGKRFRGFEKNHVLNICAKVINNRQKGKLKGYTKWSNEDFWNFVNAGVPEHGQRGKTQAIEC